MNLKQFCAKKARSRPYLMYPFRHELGLVATNGHLMVIIPDDGRKLKSEAPDVMRRGVTRVVEHSKLNPTNGHRLSDIDFTPAPVCAHCEGTEQDPEFPMWACDNCDDGHERESVEIGGAYFNTHYLGKIRPLGNCTLYVAGKEEVARFEFDGGYGCLMPVYRPDKQEES